MAMAKIIAKKKHRPPAVEETLRGEAEQRRSVSVLEDQLRNPERCGGRQQTDGGAEDRDQWCLQSDEQQDEAEGEDDPDNQR